MDSKNFFKIPDLIELQRISYLNFLEKNLIDELNNFSPLQKENGEFKLIIQAKNYVLKKPNFSPYEALTRGLSYSACLYVPIKLIHGPTGQTTEDCVCFGEIPLMTSRGHFIINGTPRVVINQLIRSPGIYYSMDLDKGEKEKKKTFLASLVPNRGSWLKLETDKEGFCWAKIDKVRKIPILVLLQAMGLPQNLIFDSIKHPEFLLKSLERSNPSSTEDALLQLHSFLRPDKPATLLGARALLFSRFLDSKRYDLGSVGRYQINRKLRLIGSPTTPLLRPEDLLAAVDYLINLNYGIGELDDIDHLKNRRIRAAGELIQNQIRVGLTRLERIILEKLSSLEKIEKFTQIQSNKNFDQLSGSIGLSSFSLSSLVSPKPMAGALREFFGSSPLCQFMDQTNPLSEMTHKRRLSSLGPGGLSRDRAGLAVREIHPSHYDRICPIETPEGPNAGLVSSLATYARVNNYGFIESPFYKVEKGQILAHLGAFFLSSDQEHQSKVAPRDSFFSSFLTTNKIPVRYREEFVTADRLDINFVGISPIQMISMATSLIPFLEHDDANRALMGSNMQRQAVPLLKAEKPIVGTGLETQVARDSGSVLVSQTTGQVTYVDNMSICIQSEFKPKKEYILQSYRRSNQETCIHQKPCVNVGDWVHQGDLLADGSSTQNGELALGQNVLIAYMPWEGYNFEDAILISERLVCQDIYTSIHIEKYEIEARQTKLGSEEFTRDIPNVGQYILRHLDSNGVVSSGAWVEGGDILVGKVTPKGESDQTPEGRLLRAIFGEKARDVKDSSLRMPTGVRGRVIDVRVFQTSPIVGLERKNVIQVYVAQKRRVQVGDKIAGRHGNKGIVSRILPIQDMPYLPNGTPVDMVLNPLGVPSRMNVGQVFESLLGLAGNFLGQHFKLTPFDEMYGSECSRSLVYSKLWEARKTTGYPWLFDPDFPGKTFLFDGRTGEVFDQPVTIGYAYMLKLVHLVDDKIHARSTGPYSLVTQQPLGGRAKHGGQRLGEMEVWALEGFGAAYTLQELLTVKSDNMQGRNEALNAIIKGRPIPKPGTPESFKVLIRELQSLCLDIGLYTINSTHPKGREEIELMHLG